MTEEFTPLEQIANDITDLGYKEDSYLRTQGWVSSSSNNPCCFWLWNHKEHGFVGMSRSTAVRTQMHIDIINKYNEEITSLDEEIASLDEDLMK